MTKPKKITTTKGSATKKETKPSVKSQAKKIAPKKNYDEEEEDDDDLDLEMDEMDVNYDKDLGFDDDDDDDDY